MQRNLCTVICVYMYTHYLSWLFTHIYIYLFIFFYLYEYTYLFIYIYLYIHVSKWDGFCNAAWWCRPINCMMPYKLQNDAVNSTASSISAMFYAIKTPETKNKHDRVKMTSCINVYTFLYICTFMCVSVCIYRQSTCMNHDYLVFGRRCICICICICCAYVCVVN